MNVTIIDDEPPAITLLSAYIQRTKFLVLHSTFTDPVDAIYVYNSSNPPQLTFLDIEMPGMNGLEFARLIASKSQIIIISSFRNYGPEAFDLSAVDYLLKPFSYDRFLDAIKKASTNTLTPSSRDFFFVRTETKGKYVRIDLPDIVFIESDDNIVHITTSFGQTTAMNKLIDVQAWLPTDIFSRVHRSYIINLNQVHAVDKGQIILKNEKVIPIGRQYKEQFMTDLHHLTITGRL
ncbi:LytTR family DNA-binding domain-containing protein [Mucilaginibacter sabulilitoris]|uniref:LytTR family DNA-binding domain-containing protein n=1 Tax=Mucilaginibacter sabulilitoris TaxID=1173583 RepID=A0ABZ0TUC1_9SPHI|nr:LytTR family DNA-binding domain-containing protein [Mucilaginibacter sabulilitoris]WPU95753.1 LytTR family DNA-binding domain-containing protein [Mucilaginibacter sabulilitoris]